MSALTDKKPCECCAVDFIRHPKDSNAEWESRRFCSISCNNRSRAAKPVHLVDHWRSAFLDQRSYSGCPAVQRHNFLPHRGCYLAHLWSWTNDDCVFSSHGRLRPFPLHPLLTQKNPLFAYHFLLFTQVSKIPPPSPHLTPMREKLTRVRLSFSNLTHKITLLYSQAIQQ